MKNFAKKYFGWFGAAIVVAMYLLNSFGILAANNLFYQLFNLFGAIFLVIYGFAANVLPNVFINSVWSIGAIVAILLILI